MAFNYTQAQLELVLNQPIQASQHADLIENGIRNMLEQDRKDGTSVGNQKIDPLKSKQHQLHQELISRVVTRLRDLRYVWVRGSVKNQKAVSIVFCLKHGEFHEMVLSGLSGGSAQRPRNPHGAECCYTEAHLKITREHAATRKKSYEQKKAEKAAKSALSTPTRPGFSKTQKQAILKKANSTCAITGLKKNVAIHHLYSAAHHASLATEPANCVVIHSSLHDLFHGLYYDYENGGYLATTPKNFIVFLECLVAQHTTCLAEINAGKRPLESKSWHIKIIKNCKVLIPKMQALAPKLEALLNKTK